MNIATKYNLGDHAYFVRLVEDKSARVPCPVCDGTGTAKIPYGDAGQYIASVKCPECNMDGFLRPVGAVPVVSEVVGPMVVTSVRAFFSKWDGLPGHKPNQVEYSLECPGSAVQGIPEDWMYGTMEEAQKAALVLVEIYAKAPHHFRNCFPSAMLDLVR